MRADGRMIVRRAVRIFLIGVTETIDARRYALRKTDG